MTTTAVPTDLLADLARRGVMLRRRGEKLRVEPVALVAEEEIEALRFYRDAILAALDTWNDNLARHRLQAAFRWADATTPAGCWASLHAQNRRRLQEHLDAAYDAIDDGFRQEDPRALEAGLQAFRRTVLAAVEATP